MTNTGGLTPDLALAALPEIEAKEQLAMEQYEAARVRSSEAKRVCDENIETAHSLYNLQKTGYEKLAKLRSTLRDELLATVTDCNVTENGALLEKQAAGIRYVDATYEYLIATKIGFDKVSYADALESEAKAELRLLDIRQMRHATKIVSMCNGLLAQEAGELSISGAASARWDLEVRAAAQRVESAENAAREARVAYERQQQALLSIGAVRN